MKNKEFLLSTDNKRRTVWLVATTKGFLGALQKVCFWAKAKLRKRNITNKFFYP
jgi:hypothetical protein